MEIKINKEIHNYKETVYFCLTARQLICSLLVVHCAVDAKGVAIPHKTSFKTAARSVWFARMNRGDSADRRVSICEL